MASAVVLSRRVNVTQVEIDEISSWLDCFAWSLPPSFHLTSGQILFSPENFAKGNWVIYTLMMIEA
jgi:hypothetical protein